MREYALSCLITCEQVAVPIPTRSSRSTSELKHCFGFVANLPESTSWGYRLRRCEQLGERSSYRGADPGT